MAKNRSVHGTFRRPSRPTPRNVPPRSSWIDALPQAFERPTILLSKAREQFLASVQEVHVKLFELGASGIFLRAGKMGLDGAACALFDWGVNNTRRLHTKFMALLNEHPPPVSEYSIERTVNQINRLVEFLANEAVQYLRLAGTSAGGKKVDKDDVQCRCEDLANQIVNHAVLWTDDFREWAEPRLAQGDQNRVARKAPQQPAWKRLRITESTSGDNIAKIDGKNHRLKGEAATKMLRELQKAKGKCVKATTLEDVIGDRPDHAYKAFPNAIQQLIDKPGRGGKGYRLS